MIDLDGLVNDDAVPYIISDRLSAYLVKRGVRYLADDAVMLGAGPAMVGGYPGSQLRDCIMATHPISSHEPSEAPGDHIAIMTLDPGCLDAHR